MKFSGSFGSWLKQRRKALDLTQTELADQVGCAAVTIQKFERDIARPSKVMTERLAEVLVIADEEHADFVAFAWHKLEPLPPLLENTARATLPDHIPPQPTPFVGRDSELAALTAHLMNPQCRLLTLVGEGGIGKTRLAMQTAHDLSPQFADGVYFVSLAPLADPELIVPTMAEAVGFQFYPGGTPKQQLLNFFGEKSMLVILDNFEHLLADAAFVSELLEAVPHVKIIATSRERLNLQEETLFRVAGMDLPDPNMLEDAAECGSVELFVQSARRVQPTLVLTAENVSEVARICWQVEGMPLGILLAAAWVDSLSMAEIAEEIAHSIDFLETEARNVPARQRSIRAVFDHSWQMLTANERTVFSQLSVFRGGFTREAAQAVTGATLKTLAALVNKSFIRHDLSGRYDMHELLRQYAAEKLEESGHADIVQNTHSEYFADYMAACWPNLKGRRQPAVLNEMEGEFNNLRTAWFYLVSHTKVNRIGNCVTSLWTFLDTRNRYQELVDLFDPALQALRAFPADEQAMFITGQLLGFQAYNYTFIGDPERGQTLAHEAVAILEPYGSTEALLITLHNLYWCLEYSGDWDGTRPVAERAVQIGRETGNDWGLARSLYFLGQTLYWQHELDAARQAGEESLRLAQILGDAWCIGQTTGFVLGVVHIELEEYVEAQHCFQQALHYFEEIGERLGISTSIWQLGVVSLRMGNYKDAQQNFKQALKLHKLLLGLFGEFLLIALSYIELLVAQGNEENALELLGAIIKHPGSAAYICKRAKRRWAELEGKVDPDIVIAAAERNKARDLETVIVELLADN